MKVEVGGKTAEFASLAEVEERDVDWLWPDRFPLGMLCLLAGKQGLGKSVLTVEMAARVSTGRAWPDGSECPKGSVVILSEEDDLARTVKRRARAAGADLSKIFSLTMLQDGQGEYGFDLKEDLGVVCKLILELGDVKLVVLDPLNAYLGVIDSHMDSAVRRVLGPVSRLCNAAQVTVLMVTHMNKNLKVGSPVDRVMGSTAVTAAARAAWRVASDPSGEKNDRVLFPIKWNVMPPDVKAFNFSMVRSPGDASAGMIEWSNEVELSADDLIGEDGGGTRTGEAMKWLRDKLKEGKPVVAAELLAEASQAGHKEHTLRIAKKALGIGDFKGGKELGMRSFWFKSGGWASARKAVAEGEG